MFRRGVLSLAAASGLLLGGIGSPVGATAAGASVCTLSGSATITPGLTTSAHAVDFAFGGSISCKGGVSGSGSVSGSGHCPSASLATCTPGASINFTSSVGVNCGGGTLTQITGDVVIQCSTNQGPLVADAVFIPQGAGLVVTNVTFSGVAVLE
jgi:hypothetical protein